VVHKTIAAGLKNKIQAADTLPSKEIILGPKPDISAWSTSGHLYPTSPQGLPFQYLIKAIRRPLHNLSRPHRDLTMRLLTSVTARCLAKNDSGSRSYDD
jgi:hypothetical protein